VNAESGDAVDTQGVAESSESQGSQQPESTWRGILRKMSMLWPFMWPRGSMLLQLCVLVCILLLVAGRVANLFLPIYYKKIGKLVYTDIISRVFVMIKEVIYSMLEGA